MSTNPKMLYILGAPGSGKTTTLRAALSDHHAESTFTRPVLHTVHSWYHSKPALTEPVEATGLLELGARREGGFGGTDALPMNAQPKVLEWLETTRPAYVIAEGDRLANAKFFDAVRKMGYSLSIAYLGLPSLVAEQRRLVRADALGKAPQNASWVRGRETKLHNLIRKYERFLTMYDATQAPEQLAATLRRHPFFHGLPPFSWSD